MISSQLGLLSGVGIPTGAGPRGSTLAGASGFGSMRRIRRKMSRLVRCRASARSSE